MSSLVERLLGYDPGESGQDGFGQKLLDDIRFKLRFRKCSRHPVVWRKATGAEQQLVLSDSLLGRFADEITGLAEVEGRACIVMERDWHGFPDPPRYAFFAFDDRRVWAAADFHAWPSAWQIAEEIGS